MNPCANKFTPLSTPILEPSSSALALDGDDHGPKLGLVSSEQIPVQTTSSLLNSNPPLTPRHTPFYGFSPLYTDLPLRNYAVPQSGWTMPVWYNPVAVAGPYCPTPPHPHPGTFVYGPVVPSLAYSDKAIHTIARPGLGDLFDIEQTRTQPRRSTTKKTINEPSKNCHGEKLSQSLISSSNLLPSTSSNVIGGSETRKSRDSGIPKQPVSAKTTHEPLRHGDFSHLDFGNFLSSNIQQSSTCSKSPSPPWSESVLPLFCNDFPIQSGNMTDNPRRQDSPYAHVYSVDQPQHYKEPELPLRSACRNAASPGSSKPRKIPSQETKPLLRPEMKICNLDGFQAFPKPPSERVERKTMDVPVAYLKQAESTQVHIRDYDSYASDDELLRLKKRGKTVVPTSTNLHSKLHIGRNESTDVGIMMKRSRSEDGAATNTTKKTSHKGVFNVIKGPMQCSVASRVGEGSWSQSKRWMSQETKERMVFHKMMQNIHHIGANNSPFIPETPLELTALRAEMAEIKKRRLSRKVEWRTATLGRRKALAQDPDEQHVNVLPFLQGKKFADNLSTVFASRNCFREYISHDDAQWVTWPSLAELKEGGDKRSGKHERYLPLPKLSIGVGGYVTYQEEDSHSADELDYGEMRAMKVDTRFVSSISQTVEPVSQHATELVFEELPNYLQKAIVDMEGELDD